MARRGQLRRTRFPFVPGLAGNTFAPSPHPAALGIVGKAPAQSPFALGVAKRSRTADSRTAKPSRQKRHVLACATLCAWTVFLGGCVHTTKANFLRHYTLNVAASSLNSKSGTPNPDGQILQLAPIVVPEWLDATAMYYRLDYEGDGRLASYANSDWIAPPAALLEPLLENAIRSGGDWRAVTGPRSPASADVALQIGLDDFSQDFSQAGESTGVLDATATLISSRDQRVIAQRHFHVEAAAPTPDAQGGAKALTDASAKFADALQRWTDSMAVGKRAAKDR